MKITFDANLCDPNNTSSTAGCFSGILRRVLCAGSLRTHPVKDQSNFKIEEKLDSSVTPGIVARLMGLETMPEQFSSLDTTYRHTNNFGGSRSVNSVEYMAESHAIHRRVKSSPSFHEMPRFLQKDDDEFLVLSFEIAPEKESETSFADVKQRRRHCGNENKENRRVEVEDGRNNISECRRRRKLSDRSSGTDGDSNLKSSNNHRKPQAERKEVELENSSPVSVFDLNEFTSEPESPLSDDLKLKVSSPRRKLCTELPTSEYRISDSGSHISTLEVRELKSENAKVTDSTKMDFHSEEYIQVWGEVCKMAEEDMHTTNWMQRELSKTEYVQEIRSGIGFQILDQLLHELIKELLRM